MGSHLIFTCLRNEGPFLLEWVAHHMAMGFDRFLIFTNDCEDGTDRMADRLAGLGLARHIRNTPQKRGPQWTALNSPDLARELETADWAIHLDADEFINAGHLDDITARIAGADAISFPWRFFGSNGVLRFADLPVLGQFTRCSPYPIDFPRQTLMFKTLFRPGDQLNRPGVHAPRPARGIGIRQLDWRTGDGTPVTEDFAPAQPVLFGANAGNALGQINHYAIKSRESFLVKSARGLPNHGNVPVDLSYWVRRNFNDVEDRTLADRPAVTNDLGADPVLKALHDDAVDWHRRKIRDILATPAGVDLFTALSVAGDTRVPDPAETRFLYRSLENVFAKPKDRS